MDVTSTTAASASASGGGRWYTGMSADNIKGLVLALSSSLFIGASFIIKKKGLKKAASSGVRAGTVSLFPSPVRTPCACLLLQCVTENCPIVFTLFFTIERMPDSFS